MDDQQKPQSQPTREPITDIQPGQSTTQSPVLDPVETPVQSAPEDVTAQPAEDQPIPATAEPEEVQPLIATTSAAAARKTPLAPIVVAVIVALALAGMAVLTYLNSEKQEPVNDSTTNTSTQPQEEQTVSPSDIDSTTQDLDDSLDQADDAADFDTNSLNDSTLGL